MGNLETWIIGRPSLPNFWLGSWCPCKTPRLSVKWMAGAEYHGTNIGFEVRLPLPVRIADSYLSII